jgi:hypothetical protein
VVTNEESDDCHSSIVQSRIAPGAPLAKRRGVCEATHSASARNDYEGQTIMK